MTQKITDFIDFATEYEKLIGKEGIAEGNGIRIDNILITSGVGRNRGKMYIHFEKVVCMGEDNKEHKFSIRLGSDGSRKVEDYGVTYAWKEKEEAEEYLQFSVTVRSFIDRFFNCSDKCKSIIAQYLSNPVSATEKIFCEWMNNQSIFSPLREMYSEKLNSNTTRSEVARMLLDDYLFETN